METLAEEASKAVISATKKLQLALKHEEPDYAVLELALEKLRVRSGNLALLYLTNAQPLIQQAEHVELKLWTAHVEVNTKFKTTLKVFRDGQGKKKHVERRKAEKLYVDFVRASQRFYRAYIGRLIANFTNIPKVLDVAQKLGQVGLTAQIQKPADEEMRRALESSCKSSVIRLGDLSRWRESELQLKERNWGPAKGYYQMALTMDPADGTCYNQLAVMARKNDDHLGAMYYLHRATAVAKPFSTAADNIKSESEKTIKVRVEESYGLLDRSGDDIAKALEKRFLAFHANCYARPYDFVAFQQKANDILGMVAISFQDTEHSFLDRFLQKACLVNIAAEALAEKGMTQHVLFKKLDPTKAAQETERNCQTYVLLQRFNLMTFQALLKVLARELGDPPAQDADLSDLSRLSSTVRSVLPHLRQYSSWFLSHMRALVETKFKSGRVILEQVCKTYAQTLNLLRTHVDVFAPSKITWLLEEDEITLAFSAFSPKVIEWRYHHADKTLKNIRYDDGNGKDMSELLAETHVRATDLIVDALRLVKQQDDLNLTVVPVIIENGQFAEKHIPETELPQAPPSPPKQVWRKRAHGHNASLTDVPDSPGRPLSASIQIPITVAPEPEIPATSVGTEKMNGSCASPTQEMITVPSTIADEQIPSTLNSSGIIVGTPAFVTPPVVTAMDLVRRMQQRSSGSSPVLQRSPDSATRHIQPSLPSVLNTPFAPTASEKAQLSPRLEYTQRRSPSHASPILNSSAIFQENIALQQREVQMRSSPQPSFQPTPSWMFGNTPTGMDTFVRALEHHQEQLIPPFVSPQPTVKGESPRVSATPQLAPFGVIGQSRSGSRGAATNEHD